MVSYTADHYDYAHAARGNLSGWSTSWGAPYGPATTGWLDPRGVQPWSTVAAVVAFDGAVLTQARVVGPNLNAAGALASIAQALDEKVEGLHAWSNGVALHLQAMAGYDPAQIIRIVATPYRHPPGAWVIEPIPAPPAPITGRLRYRWQVGARVSEASVVASGNPDADLQGVADLINRGAFLRAGRRPDGLLVAAAADHDFLSLGLTYG